MTTLDAIIVLWVLGLVVVIGFSLKLLEVLRMFIDDANAKLSTLNSAVAALAAKIPTNDTIVSLADQKTVLDGIDGATAAVNAIQVPAPVATPAP